MSVARMLLLFVIAAIAEIGGAWLIWQGVREHRGVSLVGAGIAALAAYDFVATSSKFKSSDADAPGIRAKPPTSSAGPSAPPNTTAIARGRQPARSADGDGRRRATAGSTA